MLTSKQRAYLRGLANNYDSLFQVGKSGVTDTVVIQVVDALKARELIKIKVLENCEYTAREVAELLAGHTNSEPIQVIGNKLVLFRRNPKTPNYDKCLK